MIVKINLLPWREELRLQQEKKIKQVLIISCFIGALLAGLVAFFVQEELDSRAARMSRINSEFSTLGSVEKQMNERKVQTELLKQQLEILNKLSAQRSEVVNMMEKFSAVTPQDVFIISLAFTLDELSFNALAKDKEVLAAHLSNISDNIAQAPIPPNHEVTVDGNRVVTYSVVVDPEKKTKGAKK